MNHEANQRFGKVAVLMGGISVEREVSLKSGAAVVDALVSQGVDAHGIDAQPNNIGLLQAQGFERVFNSLHGTWGEDGVVQGALESIGMPYTGSGVLGCALSMDKIRSKQIWQTLGLPTAKYKTVTQQEDLDNLVDLLGLPLFLKPACEGSSVGIGKVNTANDLLSVYQSASANADVVLAEQFIQGPELTIAILGDEALPIIRLQTPHEFYDYEAKYQSDATEYFCPAGLSDELEFNVRELALTAFKALDCSGWGRVDVMLDGDQKPLLLEVNPIPGMTDHSLLPRAAAAAGLSFEQLVVRILEATL